MTLSYYKTTPVQGQCGGLLGFSSSWVWIRVSLGKKRNNFVQIFLLSPQVSEIMSGQIDRKSGTVHEGDRGCGADGKGVCV